MGLIKCPECGTFLSDKARECTKCGFPIYLEVKNSPQSKICEYCGLENDAQSKFCTSCGAALPATKEKEPVKSDATWKQCAQCKQTLPPEEMVTVEGRSFCKSCVTDMLETKNRNSAGNTPPIPNPNGTALFTTSPYTLHEHPANAELTNYVSKKSKTITLLLCIFGGFFGLHYFYARKWGMALLYLCTFGLFYLGWFCDIVRVARGTLTDTYGYPIRR